MKPNFLGGYGISKKSKSCQFVERHIGRYTEINITMDRYQNHNYFLVCFGRETCADFRMVNNMRIKREFCKKKINNDFLL